MRTFDFHLHTRSSDGMRTAAETVELAAAAGLEGIAITDHDTLDAHRELDGASLSARVAVLGGIEVSAALGDEEVHILGYFPAGLSAGAYDYADSLVALRRGRIARGILRLRERGLDVTLAECEARASGRIVSRRHVAELLAAKRYVGRPQAAYARHLGPDVFPLPDPQAAATVRALRELGAVVLWAHPTLPQIEAGCSTLVEAGLEGVEVFIPRRSREERAALLAAARARGLLVSGGSDWHGTPKGLALGRFRIAEDQVGPFLERLGWAPAVT
jgi:predicted metal-dependent phosphoesterase TrpH